jgi:peptidoglycan/LPS O-acetylase OafA/YrhL
MPIGGPGVATPAARSLQPGHLLIAAGAILLLISLFLDWYDPGLDAWTVFEVWDIVLAALAIGALAAVAGQMGFAPARPGSWLLVPAGVAFVVVVSQLIDHPPAASGPGTDPRTGIWLALVGSALMLAGTLMSVARISVALNVGDGPGGGGRGRFGRAPGPGGDPDYPPVGGSSPTDPTRRL